MSKKERKPKHSAYLLEKSVDNGGTFRYNGGLEKVGKERKDGVEGVEVVHISRLDGNTLAKFGKNNEIDNEGRSKKRVFTGVVHDDSILATKEDLGSVLIHGTLGVADIRNVLDDDAVVRVLTVGIENSIALNHVVDNVGLGDLLGAELLGSRKVLAVIVTKMVVRDDRSGLDTSTDKEVNKDRLHLRLARLEIVTSNEGTFVLGKVDDTGNKSVLGRSVDVSAAFKD